MTTYTDIFTQGHLDKAMILHEKGRPIHNQDIRVALDLWNEDILTWLAYEVDTLTRKQKDMLEPYIQNRYDRLRGG